MTTLNEKIKNYWKKLGPGLVTGVSDDDPSGIATYSQAGAGFGFSLLWTALISYPLMLAIQEMCARIGIVTNAGLTKVIQNNYHKFFLWAVIFLTIPAVILNIAADIAGMGAVAHLLIPFIPAFVFNLLFILMTIFLLVIYSYRVIANIFKFFCLSLLCYIIVPFLISVDWSKVTYATIIPNFQWSFDYFSILVAVLGTTISPYLFFWQASMSDEEKNHSLNPIQKEIVTMEMDVNAGMFASNLAMYFIILTTGSVLFLNGATKINTVEEAAKALEPLAGSSTYFFFSLGVIGTGLLAIPVLGGSIGYILAETFGWKKGLDKKFNDAREFYIVIILSLLIG